MMPIPKREGGDQVGMCNSFSVGQGGSVETMHPGSTVDVVTGVSPQRTVPMVFGVPVEWKAQGIINARIESLLRDEGMWAGALASRRCLVSCEAFFETHRSEKATSPRTGRAVRQRYAFASCDGALLLLAAVSQGDCFAVVTTEPNEAVAPIHDRMPLVLTPEEARVWLDPKTEAEALACLADRSRVALCSEPMLPSQEAESQLSLPI